MYDMPADHFIKKSSTHYFFIIFKYTSLFAWILHAVFKVVFNIAALHFNQHVRNETTFFLS